VEAQAAALEQEGKVSEAIRYLRGLKEYMISGDASKVCMHTYMHIYTRIHTRDPPPPPPPSHTDTHIHTHTHTHTPRAWPAPGWRTYASPDCRCAAACALRRALVAILSADPFDHCSRSIANGIGVDDGIIGVDDGITGIDDGIIGVDDGIIGVDDGIIGVDDGRESASRGASLPCPSHKCSRTR
jgi:hypothetical protein